MSSFFSKCLKFNLDFKNGEKNWEKVFCCWGNCIWIDIVKLCLLRAGYFSSAVNVLTSSPKIFHIKNIVFFQLNWLCNDHSMWERCCGVDFISGWALLPCYLSKGPLKQDFWDIYMTTALESLISEIQNLWGSSFFSKYLKIKVDFKNAAKIGKTLFFSEIIASELVSLNCVY